MYHTCLVGGEIVRYKIGGQVKSACRSFFLFILGWFRFCAHQRSHAACLIVTTQEPLGRGRQYGVHVVLSFALSAHEH